MLQRLTTPQHATDLAAHLTDATRQRPAVVVTISAGHAEPFVDAAQISDDLADLAEVYLMETGAIAWALHDSLPPGLDVYGGATRIYPPGNDWTSAPRRAPLRYAYGPQDRTRVTAAIVHDALGMLRELAPPQERPRATAAGGTVMGVAGDRGIVEITHGPAGLATIWPELVADVPGEQLLRKGMPVWGYLDQASRRLDVTHMRLPAEQALAGYEPGTSILARVTGLEPGAASLEVWPGIHAELSADQILPGRDTPPSGVMSHGEILPVRILQTTPHWRVTLLDVEDPVAAAPVLEGGPPWLTAPPVEPPAARPDDAPQPDQAAPAPRNEAPSHGDDAAPRPTPSTPPAPIRTDLADAETAILRRERDELADQLRTMRATLKAEQATATRLRTELRQARDREARQRKSADQGRNALAVLEADRDLFLDPAEQLRFEVELAWARRTAAPEKDAYPLARWSIGPDFLPTLQSVEGIDRSMVVDVIVEILTGRAAQIAGRQLHPLRSSAAGDAAPVTREDGATCWRVSLQVKTPSSRRLHYWRTRDGHIELASVRVHDDIRP